MSKTENLLPIIASPENLLQAWRSIRGNIPKYRRKKCVGPDGISLVDFERDLQCQISVLRYQLLKGQYQPTQPTYFSLPKKSGGTRKIAILSISDRVVQRAVQQVIEPYWEKVFLPCSFGYRPGLSVTDAVGQVTKLRNLGNSWVVNGDIDGFFDNLDQALLLKNLRRRINDQQVMRLIESWLSLGAAGMNMEPFHSSTLLERMKLPTDWLKPQTEMNQWPEFQADFSSNSHFDPSFDFGRNRTEVPMENNAYLKKILHQAVYGSLMSLGGTAKPIAEYVISLLKEVGYSLPIKKLAFKTLLGTGCLAMLGTAVAGYVLSKNSVQVGKGVLQGSPLSPLLANIYLHPFDYALVRNGFHLVRYADDWLLLASTEDQAQQAYNEAIRNLSALHLKLNHEKSKIIPPSESFSWLGAEITPTLRKSHHL